MRNEQERVIATPRDAACNLGMSKTVGHFIGVV